PAAVTAAAGNAATPVKPKTYERLVAEADRLLENGQPGKAQKLYDEALAMQPNGVAALTGQAFVLLDREKVMSAIATFRRALAASPDYPAAVFGLAEAFRAQGETAQAIETYKRYLAVAPSGSDAPAARGQIKALEAAPPRHGEPSPTATIPADPSAPSAR
ncbi:MAG TPA: tetratricopeptide repeat protein, partial [Polyangia bacterium]|nr:tetratricopeptide repeat protein [Polyangia bacterium]